MSLVLDEPEVAPYQQPKRLDAPLRARVLRGVSELRAEASAWDDLWRRSAVLSPSFRAEMIALWVEQFVDERSFVAVVVERDGEFVAALPLITKRLARTVRVASLPANGWGTCGDLLLDEGAGPDELQTLVEGLKSLRLAALWLEQCPFEDPNWQAFRAACDTHHLRHSARAHFRVGQIEIRGNWEAYDASRDGDQRRSRNRYSRMLEKAAPATLRVHREFAPGEVESLVLAGFEIENRSWKGAEGTSVLASPGMLDYFQRQARQLAAWNQLELVFLEHDGAGIAFDFGYRAKATHFTCKVGYDEAFRKFGPGQQMIFRLLQSYFADARGPERLDFWGPLVAWTEGWATHSYPVGRLVVQLSPVVGRGLVFGYDTALPRLRRAASAVRGRLARSKPSTVGCETS